MTTEPFETFTAILPGGWRRSSATPAGGSLVRASRWATPVLASAALALVVGTAGVPIALVVACALAGGALLLIWPDLATLVVVGLLYTNIPAVAYKLHGVPRPVAASVFLLLGVPFVQNVLFRRERPWFDPVLMMMFGFLGVLLLTSFWAVDKGVAAMWVVQFVLEGIATYWLFTSVVRSLAMLRKVMYTLLVAGAFLGSLSLYQGVTHSYDQQFGGLAMRQTMYDDKRIQDANAGVEKDYYRSDRAEGPMLENNYYAQVMVVLLPLVAFLMRVEPRRSRRMAAAVLGLIILLGGVILTYSRGAVLVLGVLAVAAAWLRWVRPRYLLLMGAVCGVGILALAPGLVERMEAVASVTELRTGGQDAEADVSVRGRATEMLAAALALRDHPLLGVGPGQYMPFYSLPYQRDPSIKFKDLQVPRPAHDLYLGLAAETGLVGLTLFVAMPVWLVTRLWRERRRLAHVPALADLAAALALAIIAYHCAGLFLSFAYERYYWFLLAFAGSAVAILRQTPDLPSDGGRP